MRHILILLSLSLLFSCKKDEKSATIIEGTVINIGSKEPIDSVKVIVVDGANGQTIKYTDSSGKFNISMEGNSCNLFLEKKGYRFVVFTYGSSDNYKTYIAGKNYTNEVIELWADAYFKGVFMGTSCLNTDSIYFDEGSFIESIDNLRSRNIWWFGNGPFSPYFAWKGIGDKYFHYWMKFQIQGVWHERIDSVFIKSFTTYTDTIYY